MTTICHLCFLTMFTLIVSIHARLYLDPKAREITKLESPNGIGYRLFLKRYILAESNTKLNSYDSQDPTPAPAPVPPIAPAPATEPFHKHNDKGKKKKVISWILVVLSGAIIVVVVIVVVRWRKKPTYPFMIGPSHEYSDAFVFLEFEEDAVSSLEIIGRGGSGVVYKAEMPNGRTLAIKKILRPMKGGRELVGGDTTTSSLNYTRSLNNNTKSLNTKLGQVRSEILTVGKMRHRNILPLLCHVSRPDCDYLVTEFMKNGSLQDLLQKVKEGRREFDWIARLNVALGIAHGLEYMHMNFISRIVHRDLKPANILLGNDMEAKIADFGIAKSIPDTETHVTSSKLAGSLGYIAPEYYQTMKFDEKCDIYSFGVVLAVLVIGKLPSDEFFQRSELSLLKWMRIVMTDEDPKQAIDPKMMGNGYEEQMLFALKIAWYCTHDNPEKRPTSKEARVMLSQIIH